MIRIAVLCFFLPLFSSCDGCKEKGCTDPKALNVDYLAEKDDGSCYYSNVTFYSKYWNVSGVPILKIDVQVGGNDLGSITSYYPTVPGNCSALGTVPYVFENGESVDWSAIVQLANGYAFPINGTVSPSRVQNCIMVNVLK